MMKGFKAAGCDYAARAACVYSSLFISPSRNFLSPSHTHTHTHFWHWCRYELTIKGCIFWEFTLVLLSCNRGSERGTWEGKTTLWCLFPSLFYLYWLLLLEWDLLPLNLEFFVAFCRLGSLF